MIKRAYIEITNVCNLSCSFCAGTRRPPKFLSPDEFRLLAGKIRRITDHLYLHVMGEPLLHPQLEQILGIAGDLGFHVRITTNGTLLGKQSDLLCRAPALQKVSVSLHSFEGNDRVEGLRDYLTSVWEFCEKAPCIVELRLWNGNGKNRKNGEILSFLREKTGISPEDLPAKNGMRKLRENLRLADADVFDWPSLSAEPTGTQTCHGLLSQIAVLCDGTVVPCCLDCDGSIPLGNLFSEEPEDILSSPRAAAMAEGFRRRCPTEELCRRCGFATRFNK